MSLFTLEDAQDEMDDADNTVPSEESDEETSDDNASEADEPSEEDTSGDEADPSEASPGDDWAMIGRALEEGFGDMPEEPLASMVGRVTPKDIGRLPPGARGFVKHIYGAAARKMRSAETALAERNSAFDARVADLQAREGLFARRQAEYAQLFESPAFKKLLVAADVPDEQIDPFTPAGQMAALDKKVAQRFNAFTAPLRQEAQAAQQLHAYNQLKQRHPEMNERSFRDRVRSVKNKMEGRSAGSSAGQLERIIRDLKYDDMVAADTRRRRTDRSRRSASRMRVSQTPHSSGSKAHNVPEDNWEAYLYYLEHPESRP